MRWLARLFPPSRRNSGTTFCESCGEVCTPACRAVARRDRDRTAVLAGGLHR